MLKIVLTKAEKEGYTVGVKHRILPWYKKYQVKAHSWENFRFILNLVNGEQIYIPGFQATAVKVYANFWNHYKREELRRQSAPVIDRLQGATFVDRSAGKQREPLPENDIVKRDYDLKEVDYANENGEEPRTAPHDDGVSSEAKRRASERVRGILSGQDFPAFESTRSN